MKLLNKISQLIFPVHCPLCREIIPYGKSQCESCKDENIEIYETYCARCSKQKENCNCSFEKKADLPFVTAAYFYSGNVKNALLNLKFHSKKENAKYFANVLAEAVASEFSFADFDLVTFVPISKASLKKRGYNQSQLLSMHLAKRLMLPCAEALIKHKDTAPQHTLNYSLRLDNLKDSIKASDKVSLNGKTVLLCDDITTTGTTLKECVKQLKLAGAKEVYCICVAMTEYNSNIFT